MLMGTWVQTIVPTLAMPLAALAAATIALYGNRRLQSGLGRRLRETEEIKQRLYHVLTLAADYWAISRPKKEREVMEVRIVAENNIVISQCVEVQRHTRKLRKWYQETHEDRLDLIDVLTGGCFQQKTWSPDPERVLVAARTIGSLVSSLNRAC